MRRALLWLAVAVAGCTALPLPHQGAYHGSDADLAVTRIVHGSLVLELSTTRLLLDPWYHSGLVTRQTEPLGLVPERLPDAAAVLLTQSRATTFDPDALREIAKKTPRAIVPPPLADAVRELGFAEVTPLDWWAETRVGPVRVVAVPASRPGRENGYVVATDRVRAYFAGDTRRFDGLVDVATAYPDLDVAFLPIGGERVLGLPGTMSPAEAAKATALLNPKRVVPIAYGAAGGFPFVWWASDPVDRFRDALAANGVPAERLVVLQPGESWHYFR